jgi:hypothetical protein
MNAAPPRIPRVSPLNAWFAGVLLAVVGLGGVVVLYFFNPSTHGFFPVCQFHKLTGLNCPGCGATRAVYALLHGDLMTALRDNVLVVLALVAGPARVGWLGLARWRGRPAGALVPTSWAWALLFVALVFAVLRNLPAFSFLSPV